MGRIQGLKHRLIPENKQTKKRKHRKVEEMVLPTPNIAQKSKK